MSIPISKVDGPMPTKSPDRRKDREGYNAYMRRYMSERRAKIAAEKARLDYEKIMDQKEPQK